MKYNPNIKMFGWFGFIMPKSVLQLSSIDTCAAQMYLHNHFKQLNTSSS